MYRSANYVVFVNYEDFFEAASFATTEGQGDTYFFSGYDGDSLAFEGVTGFAEAALPAFRDFDRAWLELRTKSVRIKPLLAAEPWPRCVVAFSFTPQEVSTTLEHGVPSVERRLRAMATLAERGWSLGLRFDPLLWVSDFKERYRGLFKQVFKAVPTDRIHSVSFGPFRLPAGFFRRLERLYPEEPLLAGAFDDRGGMVSYSKELEAEMVGFCREELAHHVPLEKFFPCELPEVLL
jgi:spore photoproduct lyase